MNGPVQPIPQQRLTPSSYIYVHLLVISHLLCVMWTFFSFKDACGTRNGTFSIRVESVPCCDEALTCSRSVILDLQVNVSFSDTQLYFETTNLLWHFFFLVHALPLLFQPKGVVTLTLSDMKVTRRHHESWTLERDFLYSVRSVGLYILILVPSKGITLIWDKHTWVAVELQPHWRVSSEHYSCV